MKRDSQARFIGTLRTALGHSADLRRSWSDVFPESGVAEREEILTRIRSRSREESKKLLERLVKEAGPVNLRLMPKADVESVTAAVVRLVREESPEWGKRKSVIAWRHGLIDSLGLADALTDSNVPVFYSDLKNDVDENLLRERTINSFIGITSADYCIADSATLVLKTRRGQARSVSLVPSIHIAVIELRQILANLKELYALLGSEIARQKEGLTNCMTFISGPSKTADIEGALVHGAHGPREMYLFVITGS